MPNAGANILVVEDEAPLRELVADELAAASYRVQAAADGREALELIERSPPDLILSDIRMPHIDGFELLETTRARFPALATTPFIFLSALAERDDMLAGLNAGAEDYITKPIDFDLLLTKIHSRVREADRRRHRPQGAGGSDNANGAVGAEPPPREATPTREVTGTRGATPTREAKGTGEATPTREATATNRRPPAAAPSGRGRREVVSLAAIRARLGEDQPAHAEKLREIAEHVLRRHLAPEDAVRRNDAGDYEVLFQTLDPGEARFKAGSLARLIEARLFGETMAEPLPSAAPEDAAEIDAATDPVEAGEPYPPSVADQLNRALDDELGAAAADTQNWLNQLADRAELRAVVPRGGDGTASRLRYVRLDERHEAGLDVLRAKGRLGDGHAAQVEAIILYQFLVTSAAALNAADALYVLPVSRHLLHATPLFAIAKRVFATGLAGRRHRLLLGLPASFHRCRSQIGRAHV